MPSETFGNQDELDSDHELLNQSDNSGMVNMAVTMDTSMDNFKKRMNTNETKELESATRKKALDDLQPEVEFKSQFAIKTEEKKRDVSDNEGYSADEFDAVSDNAPTPPPRAIHQKPRPLSGVNSIKRSIQATPKEYSPDKQVANSLDKYVISLGADEELGGLSALKAGLPNVKASGSGHSFKDTSRFGAGEETFGSQIPVPRFDATDKTFDPVGEVYGASASIVPDQKDSSFFNAFNGQKTDKLEQPFQQNQKRTTWGQDQDQLDIPEHEDLSDNAFEGMHQEEVTSDIDEHYSDDQDQDNMEQKINTNLEEIQAMQQEQSIKSEKVENQPEEEEVKQKAVALDFGQFQNDDLSESLQARQAKKLDMLKKRQLENAERRKSGGIVKGPPSPSPRLSHPKASPKPKNTSPRTKAINEIEETKQPNLPKQSPQHFKLSPRGPDSHVQKVCAPPSVKQRVSMKKNSNKAAIKNAIINICCAGPNKAEREEVVKLIDETNYDNYIILFKGNLGRTDYRAMYFNEQGTVRKLHGPSSLPEELTTEMIDKFYRYNSGQKQFVALDGNKSFTNVTDGISIKKQFQPQMKKNLY